MLEQCYNTTFFQRLTNSVLRIKLKSYHGRPMSATADKNSFLYFGNVQPLQKSRYHGRPQIYKSFRKKNVGDAKFFWLKKCLEIFSIQHLFGRSIFKVINSFSTVLLLGSVGRRQNLSTRKYGSRHLLALCEASVH